MGLHNGVLARAMPEFELSPLEAEAMVEAILNYTRHLKSAKNEQQRDFMAMLFCVATIEGFRAVRVTTRRQAERARARAAKAQAANSPGGTIINMDSIRPQ